ncbi:serine hydrolase [Streptomyces erythrochromogenes]|uniref:serine hydrolase n=1 Tax=Streptomyces erythrochromogenes TaxID=285574 RepID=UPI0036A2E768
MTVKRNASRLTVGIAALAASVSAVSPAGAAAHDSTDVSAGYTAKSKAGSRYVECSSSDSKRSQRLSRDIAEELKSRKSMVSVAFYDRTMKTSCTYDAYKMYDSASTVKPIILGALLLANKGHLTQEQQTLARKMIVNSDNAATTVLWGQLSDLRNPEKPNPVRVQNFLDAAGMKNTLLDKDGSWGLTQISAADQSKLLRIFTGGDSSVLTRQSRNYALSLMRDVQDDQRWGTPAGATKTSTIHVKNGWLQRSEDGPDNPFDRGDWKVNSMGAFTGDHCDYGLVVLTENNRVPDGQPASAGWYYGIDTIERVSRVVHRDLHPDEAPSNAYQPPRPKPEAGGQ